MVNVPSIFKCRDETTLEDSDDNKNTGGELEVPEGLEWREEEHTQYVCYPKRFRIDLKEGNVYVKSLWPVIEGECLMFREKIGPGIRDIAYTDCISLSNLETSVSKSVHLKQIYRRELKSVYERKWIKWHGEDHWRITPHTRNRREDVEETKVDEEPNDVRHPQYSIHNMVLKDE